MNSFYLSHQALSGEINFNSFLFRRLAKNINIEIPVQGIDFINFCLKQGIFSWTINSLRVCSTNVLNRVSKIGIL